jgi:iron complex outermembrane receptor protein
MQFNLDYDLPALPALSVDLNVFHFGTVPATVSNGAYVPSVTVVNIGDRYKFKLLGAPATLRLQLQNLANAYIWNIAYSPGLFQFPPRTFLAYLTIDV